MTITYQHQNPIMVHLFAVGLLLIHLIPTSRYPQLHNYFTINRRPQHPNITRSLYHSKY